MISSFILNLKPVSGNGKRIKMYNNYKDLFSLFMEEGIYNEELKKVTISNFLTKDKVIDEEKSYSLKISVIDSEVNIKILQILFKIRLASKKIIVDNKIFWINNIYHDNNLSKQFSTEIFLDKELKHQIKLKLVTPTFFKYGTKYICSPEAKYVFKNLLTKFRKSSLSEEVKLPKNLNFEEIKIERNDLRKINININNFEIEGMLGEITYSVEKDNENLVFAFNFLMEFAFFAGIGYFCEKGYGQNYILG